MILSLRFVQLLISSGLLILIWKVQILHYPSFRFYDKEKFFEAMQFHQTRISLLVVPLMLAELGVTMFFTFQDHTWMNLINLVLVGLVWLTTFLVQVPLHSKLKDYDLKLISQLVKGNAIRTFLWTLNFMVLVLRFWSHDVVDAR